jgi:hypothetical protein
MPQLFLNILIVKEYRNNSKKKLIVEVKNARKTTCKGGRYQSAKLTMAITH